MGKLLRIHPQLHFPWGTPFEVPDESNGHQRGTWYYRAPFEQNTLRGPFHNEIEAQFHLDNEEAGVA